MADISKTVAVIFTAQDNASAAAQKIAGSFDALNADAKEAAGSAGQLGTQLDEVGGKAPTIDKVSTALKTLAASLIVKDFIDANIAFEKFQQSMTATTGSAELAAKEFEYVREVSNRLGVETRSTADAYAKFAASVKGTSLEGQGARDIFEAFAGTMSRVGSSSADISGAFVQLAQGISKGRFELEDLKSIAERVPGFFDAFARSLGVSTAELFKMISAGEIGTDQIRRFGEALQDNLSGASFDGYVQNFARLRNAIDESYLALGNAGAFDLLTKALQTATASVTGVIALVGLLAETWGIWAETVRTGDFSSFGDKFDAAVGRAADKTRAAADAMLGVKTSATAAGAAGETAGTQIADGMEKGRLSGKELESALKEVDKSLKALGIDPKIFNDPIKEIETAFSALADNAAASGEQIVVGLTGALQKLPEGASVTGLAREIDEAFKAGKLSADEYAQAMALIKVRLDDASPSFGAVSDAVVTQKEKVDDSAKSMAKAEEAARDWALEMEKIASNERIKFIEATVSLNVAQMENDTKRIQAAFESIDNTISTVGKNIDTLYGQLGNFDNFSWSAQDIFEKQLEIQNARMDKELALQRDLVNAQISNMNAQTAAMSRGDAMIKIDGAGLQPHLEAFMWEVLKAVQTRVNSQGLSMLLGIP